MSYRTVSKSSVRDAGVRINEHIQRRRYSNIKRNPFQQSKRRLRLVSSDVMFQITKIVSSHCFIQPSCQRPSTKLRVISTYYANEQKQENVSHLVFTSLMQVKLVTRLLSLNCLYKPEIGRTAVYVDIYVYSIYYFYYLCCCCCDDDVISPCVVLLRR